MTDSSHNSNQQQPEVGGITPFDFHGHQVRVVTAEDGEPRWVAADVASILSLGRTHDMVRGLDDDERGTDTIRTPSGDQEMTTVTEAGLYACILRSRKPEAKEFRRWITHEVLPAIRKHGGYLTEQKIEQALTDPDTIIQLATNLKEEREKRAAAEVEASRSAKVIELQAPKVAKADAHTAATEWKNRQVFYREVQDWGDLQGVKILQGSVRELLQRHNMLISGRRSDSGHITRHAAESGWGKNDKGISDSGHPYCTPKLSPNGQDIAWKWITKAFAEFGADLNPRKVG